MAEYRAPDGEEFIPEPEQMPDLEVMSSTDCSSLATTTDRIAKTMAVSSVVENSNAMRDDFCASGSGPDGTGEV